MPMPCFPASVIPDGLNIEATAHWYFCLHGQDVQPRIVHVEPVAFVAEPLAAEQSLEHCDAFILAIPKGHGIDTERMSVGGKGAGPGTEQRSTARHVIQLHDALRNVKRMMVGQ